MLHRREFLKRSSLLSLTPTVPEFVSQAAAAAEPNRHDRALVVIQLSGGNDGINTVVPFADEGYRKHRKSLRLPTDQLIKLDESNGLHGPIGLHGVMGGFGKLWDSDRLAIVQGVGYPNPNRSHDVSMSIWQTCRFDPKQHHTHGWLGRALDQASQPTDGAPTALLIGDQQPPIALRGRRSVASAMHRLDEFKLGAKSVKPVLGKSERWESGDNLTAFVQRTSVDAYTTAERLSELAGKSDPSASYPSGELAQRLRLISRLIKSGFGTRVYYAAQSGYDTHAGQQGTHARLLRRLSDSVFAFLEDLRTAKLDDRVAVLCFSEFGRRVTENASQGTDHGTAGPVFLAGRGVNAGLHADTPSLTDLEDGDLKMSIDFRRVYASVLQHWLRVESAAALGGHWDPASLFRVS